MKYKEVCPNCGYCPHCGRGGYIYPQPWIRPMQPYITWSNSDTAKPPKYGNISVNNCVG